MRTKIIHFPSGHFKTEKKLPLTSLMIVALLEACAKQIKGLHFGPGDTKGSFTALIARGLIIRKELTINHHTETSWAVTAEAVSMLKDAGIEVPC